MKTISIHYKVECLCFRLEREINKVENECKKITRKAANQIQFSFRILEKE